MGVGLASNAEAECAALGAKVPLQTSQGTLLKSINSSQKNLYRTIVCYINFYIVYLTKSENENTQLTDVARSFGWLIGSVGWMWIGVTDSGWGLKQIRLK